MDWSIIIVALVTAIPPTLVALINLYQGRKTHLLINSRMDELLSASKAESKAEGIEEERSRPKL